MGVLGDFYKLGKMSMVQSQRDILRDEHKLRDLFWECTLSCNAACKHCGSSAEKKKYEGELSTEEIKKAFKQIANDMDAKKIWINVTGGEPLVRKDLCEVMEYATNELGFRWGMTSNGLLLDKDMLEKLKKANMESVSISIDGIGKTHDEFRGVEGAYEKTIRNIKNMVDSNYFMITEVTTVFHKKNIDQLEELYEVISELGVDVWRLIPMDPIGRAKENSEYLLNGDEVKRMIMIGISYFVLFVKKVFASDMYIPPDGACNVTAYGMPHVQVENVLRGILIGGIQILLIPVILVNACKIFFAAMNENIKKRNKNILLLIENILLFTIILLFRIGIISETTENNIIGGIIISSIIVSIVLTIVYYHEKKDKKKENVQEEKYDENLK